MDPNAIKQMSPEELERLRRIRAGENVGADTGNLSSVLRQQTQGDPYQESKVLGGVQSAQMQSNNGWTAAADINAYQMGGDPAYAANEAARMRGIAANAAGRTGPTVDASTVAPWQSGAYTAGMGQVAAGAAQAGQAAMLGGLAASGGAGTGLQGQAGNALMALGQMPAGPSAAEFAMRRTADQANAAQASLAAGARGGNSALALQNAAANQGNIGTNLAGQIGVQRASEDLANRNFAANALTGASNVFGQQNQQQTINAAQAGGAYGGAGSTFGGAGQTFGTQAGLNAGMATTNANLEGQQRGQNDTMQQHYDDQGNAIVSKQADLNAAYDQNRQNGFLQVRGQSLDKSGQGTMTGSAGGDKAVATGGQVAATVLPALSDVRSKKDIAPADQKIDHAFRTAGAAANAAAETIRGDVGAYPETGYQMGAPEPAYGYRAPWTSAPAGMDPRTVTAPPSPPPAAQGGVYSATPDYLKRANYNDLSPDIESRAYHLDNPAPYRTAQADPGLSRENPFLSDVRSKSNIRDAAPAISGAFRQADSDVGYMMGAPVQYPQIPPTPREQATFDAVDRQAELRRRARIETPVEYDPRVDVMRTPLEQMRYSQGALADARGPLRTPGYEYEYKDPSSPGARPGPQYGIMAQDLEKTPAGASVVGEKNGRKFVDPGRLSLLTAAEVAKQRQELDALTGRAQAMRGAPVAYAAPEYRMGGL